MDTMPSHQDPSDSETAIRALEARYDAAWNAADLNALVDCLTEDAVIIDPRGQVSRGRDEIRLMLAPLLGKPGDGSKHTSEILRVDFVSEDVALVDGRATIEGLGLDIAPNTGHLVHRFSDIAVRRGSGWKIAHVRACPPQRDIP